MSALNESEPRPNEAIEEAAALWLAEREDGFPPERAREFERWCRADPRHAAAVAWLEQASALLEKMPLVRAKLRPVVEFPEHSAPSEKRGRFPRHVLAVGLAAAAALVMLLSWPGSVSGSAQLQYSTSPGGYERVTLADGSVLELNANSKARVQLSARERRVTLTTGEAHFRVVHDGARPFVVSAGDVAVRAVGTAFNVRLSSGSVEVLVTEGKVRVGPIAALPANDGEASSAAVPLVRAGERVTVARRTAELAAPPQVEKVEPAAIRQALAWQERKLVFADTPLQEVVAQFNRRNVLQLVIGDAELAQRPVGGTFASDNVGTFVRLLEESGDVVAERSGDRQIVLRKAR